MIIKFKYTRIGTYSENSVHYTNLIRINDQIDRLFIPTGANEFDLFLMKIINQIN